MKIQDIKSAIDDLKTQVDNEISKNNGYRKEIVGLKKYIGENIEKTKLSNFDKKCAKHVSGMIKPSDINNRYDILHSNIEIFLDSDDNKEKQDFEKVASDICDKFIMFLRTLE